jgi:hypothetical protein
MPFVRSSSDAFLSTSPAGTDTCRFTCSRRKLTGKEVWRGKVPYTNNATPMTSRTKSGRQFVVMATGTGADNALVAFALGGGTESTR